MRQSIPQYPHDIKLRRVPNADCAFGVPLSDRREELLYRMGVTTELFDEQEEYSLDHRAQCQNRGQHQRPHNQSALFEDMNQAGLIKPRLEPCQAELFGAFVLPRCDARFRFGLYCATGHGLCRGFCFSRYSDIGLTVGMTDADHGQHQKTQNQCRDPCGAHLGTVPLRLGGS